MIISHCIIPDQTDAGVGLTGDEFFFKGSSFFLKKVFPGQ